MHQAHALYSVPNQLLCKKSSALYQRTKSNIKQKLNMTSQSINSVKHQTHLTAVVLARVSRVEPQSGRLRAVHPLNAGQLPALSPALLLQPHPCPPAPAAPPRQLRPLPPVHTCPQALRHQAL